MHLPACLPACLFACLLARYTGLLCGKCDPEYKATPSSTPKRYALFLNTCVDCSRNPAVTYFLLVMLFCLFFCYIALGIAFQVKAENRYVHIMLADRWGMQHFSHVTAMG